MQSMSLTIFLAALLVVAAGGIAGKTVRVENATIRSELQDRDKNTTIHLLKSLSPSSEINIPGNDSLLNLQSTFEPDNDDDYDDLTSIESDEDLKYEVEILQPIDIKHEDTENEERFSRPSIHVVDTDVFYAENIEVNENPIQSSPIFMTLLLSVMALASVGLYVALIIWRSQLEQRYGTRERLCTEDDYCPNVDDKHFTVGISQ